MTSGSPPDRSKSKKQPLKAARGQGFQFIFFKRAKLGSQNRHFLDGESPRNSGATGPSKQPLWREIATTGNPADQTSKKPDTETQSDSAMVERRTLDPRIELSNPIAVGKKICLHTLERSLFSSVGPGGKFPCLTI